MTLPICKGVTKSGKKCSYRGRYEGYCKLHNPSHETEHKLDDCPICYEKMTLSNMRKTCCNHEFHRSCLQRWISHNNSCPVCRAPVENERPTTGVLRPRTPPPSIPTRWVPENTPVIYIDTYEELMPYLNAPIEIRFTANYWESV